MIFMLLLDDWISLLYFLCFSGYVWCCSFILSVSLRVYWFGFVLLVVVCFLMVVFFVGFFWVVG